MNSNRPYGNWIPRGWNGVLVVLLVRCVLACGDGDARTPEPASSGVPAFGADEGRVTAGTLDTCVHPIDHVLLLSVDGLAARFLDQLIDEGRLTAFEQLRQRGAYTHDARTDVTHTNTLPNHTSMLTGLPVLAPPGAPPEQGHGYTSNSIPSNGTTLHNGGNPERTYTPSVFDVVHDHGLSTAMFASKAKFSLYTNSYNEAGAPDTVGEDDGTRKIDVVEIIEDVTEMTDALIGTLRSDPPTFTFVHFNQPDATGHALGWGSDEYLSAVVDVDLQLGRIVETIQDDARLAGHTAVILTTDHGGIDYSHLNAEDPANFVIPFYVVGPTVAGPRNLYSLVAGHRMVPASDTNPGYEEPRQPIRNGDAGNLALDLLRLPSIPGSLMTSFGLALQRANSIALPPAYGAQR